jgi:hypothetical protein
MGRWGSLQNDILGSREHCHTRDVLGVQAPVRVYLRHHRFQARYWPHDHFKTDPRERERERENLQNLPHPQPSKILQRRTLSSPRTKKIKTKNTQNET